MLEVGNDEIIQAGQMARQQTPGARKIFNERIAEIAEAQPARMRNVIDDTLGTQGKKASVAKIRDEAYRQAEPLLVLRETPSRQGMRHTLRGKSRTGVLPCIVRDEVGRRHAQGTVDRGVIGARYR